MTPAFSIPRDESAVIVPALELDPVVEVFRQRHDPSAKAGVPPHVTLMYPFLEPDRLTSQALTELDMLLADVHAFDYSLTDVREFGDGVLYLAPAPAKPFMLLTRRAARHLTWLLTAARTLRSCLTLRSPRRLQRPSVSI